MADLYFFSLQLCMSHWFARNVSDAMPISELTLSDSKCANIDIQERVDIGQTDVPNVCILVKYGM